MAEVNPTPFIRRAIDGLLGLYDAQIVSSRVFKLIIGQERANGVVLQVEHAISAEAHVRRGAEDFIGARLAKAPVMYRTISQ